MLQLFGHLSPLEFELTPILRTMQEQVVKHSVRGLSPMDKILFSRFGLGESTEYSYDCIHHAFEANVQAHPNAVAVEHLEHKITYADLDRRANCLATRLRTWGVEPGARVALLVESSIYTVIGILGTLKAGAAYVPMNGNTIPDSTLAHVLRDSASSLALVQRKFAHRLSSILTIILEDSVCSSPSNVHCQKPADLSSPNDSACIVYTGAATEAPIGVDMMHRNITNLVCNVPGNLGMGYGLRVSQLMSISSDMSAWEILGSLCNGSTLCLGGAAISLGTIMSNIDIMIATPSMLIHHSPLHFPNIKVVAVAGEPCPKSLADQWSKAVQFYICWGSPEVTIINTLHLYSFGENMAIGRPTPNNAVYILNSRMEPTKIGEQGVIWAGGAGITRGYLNLHEKTAAMYRPDPFLRDGSIMFNTGNLGRWYKDGSLEYIGRVNQQVGASAEDLAELETLATAMEACPGVKLATTLSIRGVLWGFFVPSTVKIEDIKSTLSRLQLDCAVPTKFLGLDEVPEMYGEGKTARKVLEQRASSYLSRQRSYSLHANRAPRVSPQVQIVSDVRTGKMSMISLVSPDLQSPGPSPKYDAFAHSRGSGSDSTSIGMDQIHFEDQGRIQTQMASVIGGAVSEGNGGLMKHKLRRQISRFFRRRPLVLDVGV